MLKRLRLAKFESMAQGVVEGSLSRLLGGDLEPMEVASRLARALEDGQQDGQAPDVYTVALNPKDFNKLQQKSVQIETELAEGVMVMAQQSHLRLKTKPTVHLAADPAIKAHQVRVLASFHEASGSTTQLQIGRKAVKAAEQKLLAQLAAVDAYLIVDGERHVALERPLFTIGRRTDNDLVLDAPTISRRHAQIRWRYGRFVLYDLSGRPGRTLVNSQPITEYALQSGDVISLTDVKLIYAEGEHDLLLPKPPGFSQEETTPISKIE